MAKLQEYIAKNDKLTPSGAGETAWTNAGRRIGPAYNEAAHFLEKSGVAAEQLAHNAEQTAKLQNALDDQYKLLSDVYHETRPRSSGGGGGGATGGARGGGRNYNPSVHEISAGAADLSALAANGPGPPGGKAISVDQGGADPGMFYVPGTDNPLPGFKQGSSWDMPQPSVNPDTGVQYPGTPTGPANEPDANNYQWANEGGWPGVTVGPTPDNSNSSGGGGGLGGVLGGIAGTIAGGVSTILGVISGANASSPA